MGIRPAAWLLVATLVAPAVSAAEASVPLSSVSGGDRVRLRLAGSGRTIRGTIEAVARDAIVLRQRDTAAPPLRLSPAQMEKLEVARGRRSRWREGALIGFVPGAAFFGYAGWVIACDEGSDCQGTGAALVVGLVGGAATAAVGALVGRAIKTDRWVLVRERKTKVALALAPDKGGFRAAVSITF